MTTLGERARKTANKIDTDVTTILERLEKRSSSSTMVVSDPAGTPNWSLQNVDVMVRLIVRLDSSIEGVSTFLEVTSKHVSEPTNHPEEAWLIHELGRKTGLRVASWVNGIYTYHEPSIPWWRSITIWVAVIVVVCLVGGSWGEVYGRQGVIYYLCIAVAIFSAMMIILSRRWKIE